MSSFVLAERLAVRPSRDRTLLATNFDSVLVAAQAGAEWAWTLLYRATAAQLLGYIRAQGTTDAEDLLGEVFLQAARNLKGFSGGEEGFRSWLFVLAHHRVIDERRRRSRRPADPVAAVPDHVGGSTEDDAMRSLATADALAALAVLTPEQRDVVLLRVFADLSLEEVARVVRRPLSAVKALQRRGYARLRKVLASDPYPSATSER